MSPPKTLATARNAVVASACAGAHDGVFTDVVVGERSSREKGIMRIGVPTEIKNNEFRVAATPAGVHAMVS
ncbi:hypothetical protein, partial [Acidipropionibacterium timonense]|uniref:hypothetical protein n=1 Tax=Acidipropionibacterium timonense TaxID=2161818 RepID=UPI001AEBEC07